MAPGEEVLHVERADRQRDQREAPAQRRRHPRDQEQVEPRRHEREVDRAAREHEGAGDERHAPAVPESHEQREQEQEHPRRAWIEPVDQAQREREQRQSEPRRGQRAERGRLDLVAARRPVVDQCRERGSALFRVEAHHHASVDHERRHARRPDACPFRQREQRFARGRVPVDGTIDDREVRARGRERPEERLGVGTVRAAVAHEDLERARRRGCRRDVVRGKRRHGRRRECQQGGERCEGASRGARRERPPGREERVFGHRSKGMVAPVRIACR